MADYIDVRYATLLSARYPRYSVKHRNPLKINFRCPICGDSKHSMKKARGWITEIPKTGHLHYKCFNCGTSLSFISFAKQMDPNLYKDYVTERYVGKAREEVSIDEKVKTETPKFDKNPLKNIKKISQLKYDHPVKKYIESRKIPSKEHYRMYYASKFMKWINSIIPGKFEDYLLKKDEPRLVIPLIDKTGQIFGVSARAFSDNSLRYITIMFDDSPKIFGLDKVDFSKPYFVTEGSIDAMFLNNCVAMVGADANLEGLEQLDNAIFVHDFEPRNKEICDRMENLLNRGFHVCIWPLNVKGKDVNDMYLNGIKNVEDIIKKNTYSGLMGQLKLKEWRKC